MSEGLADLLDTVGADLLGTFEDDADDVQAAQPHVHWEQPHTKDVQPHSAKSPISDADNWLDDSAGVKWEKIRNAFMNAKSAGEVLVEAASMDVREWLDWVVRMAPKQVAVKADVSVVHMLDALGPIDKDAYRFTQRETGQTLDAEYKILPTAPGGEAA